MLNGVFSRSRFAQRVTCARRFTLALLLFVGGLCAPARAAIVVDPQSIGATNVSFGFFGPQTPVTNPVADPLNVPPNASVLSIGRTSPGSLEINGGSKTNLFTVWVGGETSATGRLSVTGTGSEFNATYVQLGQTEAGDLFVSNGAKAIVNSVSVNSTPAGIASSLVISGPGTVFEAEQGVSVNGKGQILTSGGAQLKSEYVYIGQYQSLFDEVATANVFGAGTKWEIVRELHVGDYGPGTLTIFSEVLAGAAYLGGYSPPALSLQNGTLTTTDLYVAVNAIVGSGTVLTKGIVADMPLVFDATHGLQQNIPIAGQPLASVALDHSQPAKLGAGFRGNGSLSISAGRVVHSSVGVLGHGLGSFGQASITGTGSKWQIDNQLDVGLEGAGELTIGAGASVDVEFDVVLGRDIPAAPSRIVFNGGELSARTIAASIHQLRGTGTIHAQEFQLDGDLLLDQPGPVPPDLVLDDQPGQHVTIDFETPGWGAVGIGFRDGGSLQIRNGAKLESLAGQLGSQYGGRGTALVEGVGSQWKSPNGLIRVGWSNVGGDLHVANGGLVECERVSLESQSKIEISGAGAQLRVQYFDSSNSYAGTPTIHVHSGGALIANDFANYASNPGTGGQLTVEGENSTFSFQSARLGAMLVRIRDGGTMSIGDDNSAGHVNLDDSVIHLDGGTIEANGSGINIENGQLLFEAGILRNFGQFNGDLWQTAGRVELDRPNVEIQGSYYQDDDAAIELVLSQLPGDRSLEVTGAALLSGTLEVVADEPLPTKPQTNGDAFRLLETQQGIIGEFENYVLPELSPGLGWSVIQQPAEIYLQIIAGDYNGNGVVDLADYTVWRDYENQSVETGTGADGNRDGYVNLDDYYVWKRFFSRRIVSSGGSGAAVSDATSRTTFAVPEPACVLMLLAAGFCVFSAARCRPV